MKLLDYLDRIGERRLERWRLAPPRPRDTRLMVGVLFFLGYYTLVYAILKTAIPSENAPLVRDAMLVLGPVVGAIGQAIFRTDAKDEITANNTGAAFRAVGEQAKATVAAAATTPADSTGVDAARRVANAAEDEADAVRDAAPTP